MIRIDGSQGEGGGQILRTALSLSTITGKPFTIYKIRNNREKPGILNQHLTAVKALATICNAKMQGNQLGSQELYYEPGSIQSGTYFFNVGTAGSCALVLQALIPVLLQANAPSSITLEGGTHNPLAPPYEFLEKAFLPILVNMGAWINPRITTYGFYPAGGGTISLEIAPALQLHPLDLYTVPENYQIKAYAFSSQIPLHVIHDEIALLKKAFQLQDTDCVAREVTSPGPGNVVMVEVRSSTLTEVFTSFGARGLPLQKVCAAVIKDVHDYLKAEAAVGSHLADQLLIPLAMAGGNGFLTTKPTRHTLSNIPIIRSFLDVNITTRHVHKHTWEIKIEK